MSQYVRGSAPASSGSGGGGGIQSINSDTTPAQLIVAASTGTDFTVATAAGTTTIAIPSASATARGLMTTGVQTLAGAKTFSGAMSLSSTLSMGGNATFTNTANRALSIAASAAATTGKSLTIQSGSSGAGTDLDAGDLILATGTSTGSSANAIIDFRVPGLHSSGTTANSLYSAVSILTFDVESDFSSSYPEFSIQSSSSNKSITFLLQSVGNETALQANADQTENFTISNVSQPDIGTDSDGGFLNLQASIGTGNGNSQINMFVGTPRGSDATTQVLNLAATVVQTITTSEIRAITPGSTDYTAFTSGTSATNAGVGTLTNMPTGKSGNPTGYLQVSINGTIRVIPFW